VLAPHADDVAPALCGVEQQREREPRLRADGMMRLELRDLLFVPRGEAVRFSARHPYANGRIGFDRPLREAPPHERATHSEYSSGAPRFRIAASICARSSVVTLAIGL